MTTNIVKAGALILFAAWANLVQAQAPDVGLVNLLSGEVTLQSEGNAAAPARAYMKIREGDRFSVRPGAQVRVVYFEGGRQETWNGPAAFRAGREQSESSGQPAAVTTLPSSVPQRIAKVPQLIQVAKLARSGGVSVRGMSLLNKDNQALINEARETYKALRAEATADDIMPELYLYSVLQEYSLYEDMKPLAEEMVKRQPDNAEVRDLLSFVNGKLKSNAGNGAPKPFGK